MGTSTCPVCGKPIADTYARVVGFYTPVSSYQDGAQTRVQPAQVVRCADKERGYVMHVKGVIEEDFVNYKVPSMFINTCFCDFKCCTELGLDIGVCQNSPLAQSDTKEIADSVIYKHFTSNPIAKAVVIGGMEPMMQIGEVTALISLFRENGCTAPFVIYTGYYPSEISKELDALRPLGNIVVKFGRFIPNKPSRYDDVLGIELSSDNQFAERIS